VPQQPLLADRAEFELAVSSQTTRGQRHDRYEHNNRRRDGNDEGADHSVINIRPSPAVRKQGLPRRSPMEDNRRTRAIMPSNQRGCASSRTGLRGPCRHTTRSLHRVADSTRLRRGREDRRVERSA